MQIKISYLTFDQLKNQDDITFLKFSVFVIGSLFWNPGYTTLKSMGGQVVLVREIRFTLEQFCGPDSSVLEKWKDFFQRLFLDFDHLRSLNN